MLRESGASSTPGLSKSAMTRITGSPAFAGDDDARSLRGAAGRTRHAPVGAARAGPEVVGIPGPQAGPLRDGTAVDAEILFAFRPSQPAGRRVLPLFLPSVDGQVEQSIAVIHRL